VGGRRNGDRKLEHAAYLGCAFDVTSNPWVQLEADTLKLYAQLKWNWSKTVSKLFCFSFVFVSVVRTVLYSRFVRHFVYVTSPPHSSRTRFRLREISEHNRRRLHVRQHLLRARLQRSPVSSITSRRLMRLRGDELLIMDAEETGVRRQRHAPALIKLGAENESAAGVERSRAECNDEGRSEQPGRINRLFAVVNYSPVVAIAAAALRRGRRKRSSTSAPDVWSRLRLLVETRRAVTVKPVFENCELIFSRASKSASFYVIWNGVPQYRYQSSVIENEITTSPTDHNNGYLQNFAF